MRSLIFQIQLSRKAPLVAVAFLWGSTNPLIKKGSEGIVKVKGSTAITQFLLEIKYLATNVNYLVPMALNQFGSILYFFALQNVDLSLAVPVANSLTFVFTALSGIVFKEGFPSKRTYIGMCLVLLGTSMCCYDKHLHKYIE